MSPPPTFARHFVKILSNGCQSAPAPDKKSSHPSRRLNGSHFRGRVPSDRDLDVLPQQPAPTRWLVYVAPLRELVSPRHDLRLPLHGPLQPERLQKRARSLD